METEDQEYGIDEVLHTVVSRDHDASRMDLEETQERRDHGTRNHHLVRSPSLTPFREDKA